MDNNTLSKKVLQKPCALIFAIRKETTNEGKIDYIPVVATKPLFKWMGLNFTRIIKIEGTYHLQDFYHPDRLTEETALAYIQGYKQQLELANKDKLATIEIIQIT